MQNLKPDFIIVGAMKGGTSSLAYLLENQNDIVIAPGEVNYFDNDKNYSKGNSWYLKQFRSDEHYKIWGEKTATYHYADKVPERMFNYNPNVKIVWILRNPIYRAYSNYWHKVKYGGEFNSFEEAIQNEINATQDNIWRLYLKRSKYVDQIKAFNKYFEYEQMHIIIFEEFVKDIKGNLTTLLDFIGVENKSIVMPPKKRKNVTHLPSSPIILKYSKAIFGNTVPFKIVRKLFEKKTPGYPKLISETEDFLKTYFQDSIEELEQLTKLDLSIWK